MMRTLVFEKVGDINSLYPYLCVYFHGDVEPFMEIGITNVKELAFTFYALADCIVLDADHWEEILRRGRDFLPKALADEDASY